MHVGKTDPGITRCSASRTSKPRAVSPIPCSSVSERLPDLSPQRTATRTKEALCSTAALELSTDSQSAPSANPSYHLPGYRPSVHQWHDPARCLWRAQLAARRHRSCSLFWPTDTQTSARPPRRTCAAVSPMLLSDLPADVLSDVLKRLDVRDVCRTRLVRARPSLPRPVLLADLPRS